MAKRIKNATRDLMLRITRKHVMRARCRDPRECVVGQAIKDHFSDFVAAWAVGADVTKIQVGETLLRYSTPYALRMALQVFDKTGHWNLPAGDYLLKAYVPVSRWHKKKPKGKNPGIQSIFRPRMASAPTRVTIYARDLMPKGRAKTTSAGK